MWFLADSVPKLSEFRAYNQHSFSLRQNFTTLREISDSISRSETLARNALSTLSRATAPFSSEKEEKGARDRWRIRSFLSRIEAEQKSKSLKINFETEKSSFLPWNHIQAKNRLFFFQNYQKQSRIRKIIKIIKNNCVCVCVTIALYLLH